MKQMEIEIVPYFDDNFAYLIHDPASGKTALIDCGESEPVLRRLKQRGWKLDLMMATHFHFDHAGELGTLKKRYPEATVVKPAGESRLSVEGTEVGEGDSIPFAETEFRVFSLPAHTMYCTAYLIDGDLFVGDALFSVGCGRLFEGGPAELEASMDKICSFPEETRVFFGHEYTQANIRFAKTIEPENTDLQNYSREVDQWLEAGRFSTPTTVALEKKVNPFLRIDQPEVIQSVDPSGHMSRTDRLGALRAGKDRF